MRLFVCSALMVLLTSPFVLAEKVVLGMSQDEVAITATFDGSNILVFGAIQRDAPIPETPIDVIVTVSGTQRTFGCAAQSQALWDLGQYRYSTSGCGAQLLCNRNKRSFKRYFNRDRGPAA